MQHRRYRMTCESFDLMLAEADGRCACCGLESAALVVDHDHDLGDRAVRGLICVRCNRRLYALDAGLRRPLAYEARYLANAWHERDEPAPVRVDIPPQRGHLVGAQEIADMFGVSRQRTDQLSKQAGFPAPTVTLTAGRVWITKEVREWAESKGREILDSDQ